MSRSRMLKFSFCAKKGNSSVRVSIFPSIDFPNEHFERHTLKKGKNCGRNCYHCSCSFSCNMTRVRYERRREDRKTTAQKQELCV